MRPAGAFISVRKNGQRLGKEQGSPHEHPLRRHLCCGLRFPVQQRAGFVEPCLHVWRGTLLVGKGLTCSVRECYPCANLRKPTLFALGLNPALRIMIWVFKSCWEWILCCCCLHILPSDCDLKPPQIPEILRKLRDKNRTLDLPTWNFAGGFSPLEQQFGGL